MKKLFFCALLLFCNSSHAQFVPDYVPKEGLLAWFPFNSSNKDESGNGRDFGDFFPIMPPGYTQDRCGIPNSAARRATANQNQDLVVPFPLTVNVWIKPNLYNTDWGSTIIGNFAYWSYGIDMFDGWYIGLHTSTDSIAYPVFSYARQQWTDCSNFNGLTENCMDGSAPSIDVNLYDDQWHMLTYRVDETGGEAYIDGLSVSEQSWVGPAGPAAIGWGGLMTRTVPGATDDIALWNRALSDEEVLHLYTGNKCLDFEQDCSFVNLDDFLNADTIPKSV